MIKSASNAKTRGQQLIFVTKEIQALQKNPDIAKTTKFELNETDLSKFIMIITPIEGLYMGLSISFELTVPESYPVPGNPINAKCLDTIYHPNIFDGGRLCLQYDNTGNFESGYKETLENLVIAINYLFIHPGNYKILPENVKLTIKQNIDAYKKKEILVPFASSKEEAVFKMKQCFKPPETPIYRMEEIYDSHVNHSLLKIKDWHSYFPSASINISTTNMSRYFMFTLGGKKIMDMAKLEDVFSHIIYDPRYHFDTVENLSMLSNPISLKLLVEPTHENGILLSKFKKIIYPDSLTYDPLNNCYSPNIHFNDLLSLEYLKKFGTSSIFGDKMTALCNIVIRSNYRFKFTCKKDSNNHMPVLDSEVSDEVSDEVADDKTEYIMKIDQYIHDHTPIFSDRFLMVYDEPNPTKIIWFYISYSRLCFGTDIKPLFNNIAFKFNPFDGTSPWVTLRSVAEHDRTNTIMHDRFTYIDQFVPIDDTGLRFLTEAEIKLVSGGNKDVKVIKDTKVDKDDDYDIMLASKYLAKSCEETGLDIRNMNSIS